MTLLRRSCCALLLCLLAGQAAAQGVLWEAQRGRTTILLLGSVHVCDAACYPFAPAVQQALGVAQAVAVELDAQRPEIGVKLAERGFYPPGQSLRPLLPPAQLTRLNQVLTQQYGKQTDPLLQMRPWLFQTVMAILAAEKVGLDPRLGIDLKLMEQARQMNKPVLELETIDEQIDALETLTGEDAAGSLNQVLDSFADSTLGIHLSNLVVVWKRGDLERMQKILLDMQTEQEKRGNFLLSLQQRNQRMVERMMAMAEQHKVLFAAVGAAHYFEPGGILGLLRQRGFQLRRLPTEMAMPARNALPAAAAAGSMEAAK